ncbi:MAG: class I SAM-dependent methyltransferase [Rickettsiales bacterium]
MSLILHSQNLIRNIHHLGIKNQILMRQALDLRLFDDARQYKRLDNALSALLRKAIQFDFVGEIARGRTLLVGEGNLSFALSLIQISRIVPARLFATTFENSDKLPPETFENAQSLNAQGVIVLHGIDATDLSTALGSWLFDNIVFQFPHAGVRGSAEGRNPNFILIRNFLVSAYSQLAAGGRVLISAVDTPHYRGGFQFEEAAKIAGFKPPQVYPFAPTQFPGYEHTMTHESGSALENHDTFSTWVFSK